MKCESLIVENQLLLHILRSSSSPLEISALNEVTNPNIDRDTYDNAATFPSPIDVDALDSLPSPLPHPSCTNIQQCCGFKVHFPPGESPHSSYPYGVHNELGNPWDYSVTRGVM